MIGFNRFIKFHICISDYIAIIANFLFNPIFSYLFRQKATNFILILFFISDHFFFLLNLLLLIMK